jgi:hypothetical protein
MFIRLLINVNRNATLKRKGIEIACYVLADSRWKMFSKAVRQPLGTAKRLQESHWEMPKGY